MNVNTLERPVKNTNSYTLNVELKELITSGIVNFYSKKEANSFKSFWDGEKLTIPVYGIYKISWGFQQNSLDTFYKEIKSELRLVINDEKQKEKAEITKITPSLHAVKSCGKEITFLFREGDTLHLDAVFFNTENLNMKNVYLQVDKLNIEDDNVFGYEN